MLSTVSVLYWHYMGLLLVLLQWGMQLALEPFGFSLPRCGCPILFNTFLF